MKKISVTNSKFYPKSSRFQTEQNQKINHQKPIYNSVSRFSCIDEKQNGLLFQKFQSKTHRKSSQALQYRHTSKQNLLRNILQSNSHKRSELLNNLIKSKQKITKKGIYNDHQFKKNIRMKTQESEKYHYPLNTFRAKSYSKNLQSLKTVRNQKINFSKDYFLTDRKRSFKKLSIKDSEILKRSFNKRMKEIKLKKHLGNDQNEMKKIKQVEVYGSSLKGQKHEQNQDSIFFSSNVFVLCDGHGSNGKQVSNFISQIVHNSLKQCLEDGKIDQTIILETYRKIDLQLNNSNLDISFSGCTCVAVVKLDNNIFCISLGDSKAIMAKNGYNVLQISKQHKPSQPQEKSRIQNYGGVIKPIEVNKDKFVGPMRIWAPGKNPWGPGLALSRAFGDKAARKYGLISVPQITQFKLNSDQQFIILGSDGLFDYFQDQQISFFVRKLLKDETLSKKQISNELVNQSRKRWPSDADDISCIIIFL